MMAYHLSVVKNLALIDYDTRLKSYRELQAMMAKRGMIHEDVTMARVAARAISSHPLVTSVTITNATPVAVFQNGKVTR